MSISVTSARTAIYLLPYINHTVTVAVQLKQEAGSGHGYPAIPCRDNATITTNYSCRISGRRNHSWPAGSACVLTAGRDVLGDRRVLLSGPAARWVCTGECRQGLVRVAHGARPGVRGSLRGRRGAGGRVPTAVAPAWVWAARCSAPEPSGDNRTCVPAKRELPSDRGVPGRGATRPIAPYRAINYSAEVRIREDGATGC